MAIVIPPWLEAADAAGQYTKGLQIGVQVASERGRLQQEAAHAEMEAQAHQQQLQAETQLRTAQIETQKAYHQEQLGLRAQRLQQLDEVNAAKTQAAALRLSDERGFAADLASGMPIEQALMKRPTLATPNALIAAHKETQDAAGQTLALRERSMDLRERQIADQENKPGKIGTMDIPLTVPGASPLSEPPTMHGVPLNSPMINQVMGTNAPPGTGTNYGRVPLANAARAPFADGTPIRSKKDNKLYTVVNGVPVLADEQDEP